ncbi:ABC transporter permease [soil metagenome]
MFKNYFKIALRNLLKNKLSSFINIVGLSVGLATGIIIMLVIADEFNFNKFNTNLADIRLLMKSHNINGDITTDGVTSGPLAAMVSNDIPEAKYVVRTTQPEQALVRYGNKTMYQKFLYADADFLDMMTFPAIKGDATAALKDPGSVIITAATEKKLFGNEDAMGKIIMQNDSTPLKVAAVLKDIPQNSTIQFKMLLPFHNYESNNSWLKKWDDNRIQTWVQVKPGIKASALDTKLTNLFLKSQNEKNMQIFAYPMADLRLYGKFKNGKAVGGNIYFVTMLGVLGLFVLLIACINFMNLATARSEGRAREVGVRKVMGATRKLIILQFLTEALVLALLAFGLGLLLAKIALPGFMQLTGKHFSPDYTNGNLWTLLIALGLVTGLLAGSYPALYLSRFQPVKVLKSLITRERGGGMLRKGLVTFQFVISIFLIITTIVIYRQIDYVQHRPIGYNADNLIDIPLRGDMSKKFNLVKNQLAQLTGVKSVSAGTDNLVFFGGAYNGLEWPGKTDDQDFYITSTYVQYDWIKTAGLQLTEGRDFSPLFASDSSNCLINEAAAKRMQLKEPVAGTKLGKSTIIGVVKDFVYNDPSRNPAPMIVNLGTGGMSHFLVRIVNDENWKTHLAKIEKAFKNVDPNYPFEFSFTKAEYQKRFDEVNAIGQMSNVFGGMAIFISCLGLFGLSGFLAERRSKEVSIRKVLGATVSSIWFTLSKDFLKPVLIAFVIAAPIAGYAMQKGLSLMDYHINLSWWIFVLAAAVAIIVALITVSFNGIKAAIANPVKSLKME